MDASPFQPDADFDFGDDAAPAVDAAPGSERVIITYNDSTDILQGQFASCIFTDQDTGEVTAHAQSNYFRVFDLSDFGIESDFLVETVHIGVSRAEGSGGSQNVQLAFGAQSNPDVPDPANVDVLLSGTLDVSDREQAFMNPIVNRVVPAGQSLYIELALPDGRDDDNVFLVGVNKESEGAPGFISADACGFDLRDIDSIDNFQGNHWVVAVTGVHEP